MFFIYQLLPSMTVFDYLSDISVNNSNEPALLFNPDDIANIYCNEFNLNTFELDLRLLGREVKEEIFNWFMTSLDYIGFSNIDRIGDQVLVIA